MPDRTARAPARPHGRFPKIHRSNNLCWALLCGCAFGYSIGFGQPNRLGVYSLSSYGKGIGNFDWKPNIHLDTPMDPYFTFWGMLTCLNGQGFANADFGLSQKLVNQEVTLNSIVPMPNSPYKTWDDFNLVFFYGHNNTVTPPHPHDPWYVVNSVGDQCPTIGTFAVFEDQVGTPDSPYDYYATRHIINGLSNPGALTYLYNAYTSSLLGPCYDYAVACDQEVTTGSYCRNTCSDPALFVHYPQLGERNLKWLILDGCQAVINANDDATYNSTALRSLPATHGGWHIVMGHYKEYSTGQAKDLTHFSYSLLQHVPIQTAYFDTDPARNSSAIAAENQTCNGCNPSWNTMNTDRWGTPVADPPAITTAWSQRWIRNWTQIWAGILHPPPPIRPPTGCAYTLTPSQQFHSSGISTGMVNVATSAACSWSIFNSNGWLTIISPTTETNYGNGIVIYTVTANPNPDLRSGVLLIGDQAFTVYQWGFNCGYVISAVQGTHGPGAETGTVGVTTLSGCPWSVSNSNSWVTLLSPTNNAGSGTVTYSVMPNLSPTGRTGVVAIASQPFEVIQSADPLTMGVLSIDSPAARTLLGMDTLPFRQIQSSYVPTSPVPVLQLESVSDAQCYDRLNKSIALGFFSAATFPPTMLAGNLLVVRNDTPTNNQSVAWVDRNSGSYSFTRVENSMSLPTPFTNYEEAVQLALAFVGTQGLIQPALDEQVDLLYVSAVENAYTSSATPDSPLQQFRSDYYVAFGRRFRGVPIIGSELVLRLDGNRQIAMIRKNWRRIMQASSELITPSTNSVAALLTFDPRFYAQYTSDPRVDASQISIVEMKCGYMEAPLNFRQHDLRLGGCVKFLIGTNAQENFPQMNLSLEDGGTLANLWGHEYQPSLLSVQSYAAGGVTLRLASSSGYNYDLQTSSNLTDWVRIGTMSNVTNAATFVDSQGSGFSQRFYRAVEVP